MLDYEKLGSFYLGKSFDLDLGRRTDDLLLYDSKDLVTHAVCVGMTGSGKTGLCIGLLEEAAIDGIPALIIDPKGDLGNLLLTFPALQGADFRPWVNESDAQTKGLTPDDFAQQQATLWKKGLADWHQSPDRIARLRGAADVVIFTPGSNAGLPLSILKSFDCPPPAVMDDPEAFRERVQSSASSVLALLGISGDPLKSREHIFLSNVLSSSWQAGENLDLAALIAKVQSPGFSRVGVMDVETFFPAKDRFELAMTLNNLLASPGFSAWMEGEAMDVGKMLVSPSGKPRLAIVSIAHLNDSERMFVVSMLLSQMLAWVRSQSGTTSLRALLYMDEIAGYFPPTANPPSKQPLLTLMKQARAFGVGVVLATQNPVDLDYKGLSNAGTWFIGRLQTEQDKARLLDGLEGAMSTASKAFDRGRMERVLSGLGKRVFLMNNVHEDEPAVFETRWCLSYLRGPLTRQQIKGLMDPVKANGGAAATRHVASAAVPAPLSTAASAATSAAMSTPMSAPASASIAASAPGVSSATARPALPPDVPQYFVPLRSRKPEGASLRYDPGLIGFAKVRFTDTKAGIDTEESLALTTDFVSGPISVSWDDMQAMELSDKDLRQEPEAGASFGTTPAAASKAKSYNEWSKDLSDSIFRAHELQLLRCEPFKVVSKPGETEGEFKARVAHMAREQRDEAAEKLRTKYATKFATLAERLRKAEQALETQKSQATSSKVNAALGFGAAILGGLLGRKVVSAGNVGKAATAMRGAGRAMQESGDVGRAEENIEAVQAQLRALEEQVQGEVDALTSKLDSGADKVEVVTLRPKKTNISVQAVVLAWKPVWVDGRGNATSAWE
jgi:hypothetical protein